MNKLLLSFLFSPFFVTKLVFNQKLGEAINMNKGGLKQSFRFCQFLPNKQILCVYTFFLEGGGKKKLGLFLRVIELFPLPACFCIIMMPTPSFIEEK